MLPVDDPPNAVPDIYRDRFERCFRDHYAQMLAFSMRRVSGREIAEDVVADTFAVAWRRRDRIPDPTLPWLYAIAGHVIANQYRSTRRRHNLDMRLAHETGTDAPGSDPAESLGRRDAFSAAFALLGEPEREVLPPSTQAGSHHGLRAWAPRRVHDPGRGGPGKRHGVPNEPRLKSTVAS
jgi:hypothetical protein